MRLHRVNILFKFKVGQVNVEQQFEVEPEPGERIDWLSWIDRKVKEYETAGYQSPVAKSSWSASPTAMANGATGRDPITQNYVVDSEGRQEFCPKCKKPLVWKDGNFKTGNRKGHAYHAKMHEVKSDTCDYVDWGD